MGRGVGAGIEERVGRRKGVGMEWGGGREGRVRDGMKSWDGRRYRDGSGNRYGARGSRDRRGIGEGGNGKDGSAICEG